MSPLAGLICEIVVNSLGQGNFLFFQKSQGTIQGNSKASGCGNHVLVMLFCNLMFHEIPLPGSTFESPKLWNVFCQIGCGKVSVSL